MGKAEFSSENPKMAAEKDFVTLATEMRNSGPAAWKVGPGSNSTNRGY